MKKSIFTIVVVLSMGTVFGQGLSLGFKTGFNFPMSGQEVGTHREVVTINGVDTQDDEKVVYGTFGQGIPLTLDARYMFNENIGIQLDLTYLIGVNKMIDYEKRDITTPIGTFNSETKGKVSTQQFRLSPQLVIKAKGVYARAGLALPLFGSTKYHYTNENTLPISGSNPANNTDITLKYTGKFSVGFIGAVGYQFDLSDKIGLFGEVEYLGLSIKRKQMEYTEYTADGVDQLQFMTTDQKITKYDDKIDNTSTTPNQLGVKGLYSSLGIQIGVRFNF